MKRRLIVALMLALSAFFAERASAQTVSAHGSGTVGGFSDCCVTVTSSGGKGVSFNFNFSGSPADEVAGQVVSTGVFKAVDMETNIQLAYSGRGLILPQNHELLAGSIVTGDLCSLTTPDGLTGMGPCFVFAIDNSSNGRADEILFFGAGPNGDIVGCGGLGFFPCTKTPSGNITID